MAPNDIRFESIKEDRGWYFVEYSPPLPNYRFSTLQLSIVEPRDANAVATAMELEATSWLSRYPVPLMVTAFTIDSDVFSLESYRPNDYLMAWSNSAESKNFLSWEPVTHDELPTVALNQDFLKETFSVIPYKTGLEIQNNARKQMAKIKAGWWIVFLWAAVVPLFVAVLEWWSDLLGLVVLAYAFVKAAIEALRLTGRMPKSQREREREAKDLKMRHYYYHCERNIEAFERLKIENFRREEIEKTKAEALALKTKQQPLSNDS